jgi:hypothetical protein
MPGWHFPAGNRPNSRDRNAAGSGNQQGTAPRGSHLTNSASPRGAGTPGNCRRTCRLHVSCNREKNMSSHHFTELTFSSDVRRLLHPYSPALRSRRLSRKRPEGRAASRLLAEQLEDRVTPSGGLLGLFELDGNAQTGVVTTPNTPPGSTTPSHDWDQIFADAGSPTGPPPAVRPLPTVRPAARWEALSSTTRPAPTGTTSSRAARRTSIPSARGGGRSARRRGETRPTSSTPSPAPTWTPYRAAPRSGTRSCTPA